MTKLSHSHQHRSPMGSGPAEAQRLIARANALLDSKPAGPTPIAWSEEARHVGDFSALAIVALRD
jgi:hypothetical protein